MPARPQLVEQPPAVHRLGQHQVDDCDLWLVRLRLLECLVGVLGHRDLVAEHPEICFQDHPPGPLIVYDEDRRAPQIFRRRSDWFGRGERHGVSVSVAMPSSARSGARSHAPSRAVKGAPARPKAIPRKPVSGVGPSAAALVYELGSCVTEADLLQVLYRGLHPRFGYEVIVLHVLEREGWYRSLPIDSGVLQDVSRLRLSKSMFAKHYANPRTTVVPIASSSQERGKGPGVGRQVRFAIWVPVKHQGEVIGSVIYQSHRKRRVADTEVAFLDDVHRRLGVLLANASLNELTRNQARRLEALNSIGRAMASTLGEARVLNGLP